MGALRFGGFVLDSTAGELRRGVERVEMRPKLFTLLSYFVEHSGRLIPKEELMEAVWPDVTVSDGSLNRSVAELRVLLGDDSKDPHMIETVPRRGYRFIADVHRADAAVDRRASTFVLVYRDRTIPLCHGENFIGRMPDCDVQIIAGSVSRRHALIVTHDETATIEDLGSTNGTFVDKKRIEAATPISAGQEFLIGKEPLRLIDAATLMASTEKVS